MFRIASGSMVLVAVLAHALPAAADPDVYPPPPVYQGAPPPGYQGGYPPPGYQGGYPPPAYQGGYPPPVWKDPTAETHDGTYLRLYAGPGYLHSSVSAQGSKLVLKGPAFGLGVAVGGTVAPNLIIYGEFTLLEVSDPTVTVDGTSASGNATSFDHIGFGPGVTYYFMPLNLYLSGSFIFSRLQVADNNNNVVGQTNLGASVHLSVGKDWWVSPQWGLGAAVQGLISWNRDSSVDSTFTTTGFMVAFSATYN